MYRSGMVFQRIESRLEALVEGMFGRVFRSELQPVEISRALIRYFDTNKTIDAGGRLVGPNSYQVRINPNDFERLSSMMSTLIRDSARRLRSAARDQGAGFVGAVRIDIEPDDGVRVGRALATGVFDEAAEGTVASAWLELPDGTRLHLAPRRMTFGRLPDSDVVLDDPNCSRHHAELHPDGDSFTLVDLGSTNGSKVNGVPVSRQLLVDGDTLTFGVVVATFRHE